MKRIKYTPDAAEKLHAMNQAITLQYGKTKADKIVKSITKAICGLAENEKKGPSVANMFDVASDYRYIFISGNYVFYRIEDDINNVCL